MQAGLTRFTVAVDRRFKIAGEVLVKRSRRSMFFGETKRLRKQADMRFSGTNHRHRPYLIANHDFDFGTDPCQHVCKVAGGFRFRDVDDVLRHERHYIATHLPPLPHQASLATRRGPGRRLRTLRAAARRDACARSPGCLSGCALLKLLPCGRLPRQQECFRIAAFSAQLKRTEVLVPCPLGHLRAPAASLPSTSEVD